ncbi:MAG: hypothetical protein FJ088_13350, partial [Deltaproteobacteria bacterium]|nr:hypothetical protein [Deltaproteobacteria bacterium]
MRCFILLTAVFFSACGGGGGTGALENTKELCRDGLDNDNDGFEDCSDQDCWQFVVCLDAATDEGEKEAASDVWYADADGADFSKEYEEVFLFEEDVFIGGCDPCGYGTLTGVVCAPNGKDAVPDALVWIDALDCEGKPVHLETKSLYTGVYKLDGVPCGAQTINISKGSFSHKFNFYVNKELVNDTSSASGDRCLEKDAAKILVLWGQWDTFEGILDELGFAYDYYNFKYEFYEDVPWEEIEAVNLLRDPEGLKKYDIVFMNCASWPD